MLEYKRIKGIYYVTLNGKHLQSCETYEELRELYKEYNQSI